MTSYYETYLHCEKFKIPVENSNTFIKSFNYLSELCDYKLEVKDVYKNPSFGHWEIGVRIVLESDFDESRVDSYIHEYIIKLESYLGKIKILTGDNNAFGSFVLLTEIPKFKVKSKYVNFDLITPREVSFHNISNMIECEEMTFSGNLLKVKDSVLGILKVKKLKLLDFRIGSQKVLWVKIIKKHFNGDRDLMDCAEELHQNDLEEYAQL